MDQRLRQRLVGAIVLISLAVIFIPIILEGPDDESSPRTQDMPEPPRVEYQAEVELPLPATLPEPAEAPEGNTVQEPVELAIPEPPAAGDVTEPRPAPADSAPAPAAAAPVPSATQTAESWVIQVGSFSQQANARGLRDRLVKAGYTSRLQEIKAGAAPVWRVLVGPYGSREQAERQRDRISREQQLKGLVTRDQG